ncbi:MAG: hypothetical protein ACXWLH_01570 [Candidatus Saccharimonadales bacterium]
MSKLDQKGGVITVVALSITFLLLIGALVFGFWAYSNEQKYKNNTDQIVAQQVKIAVDKNSTDKDNQFAEVQKSPVKIYNGPSTYGSIILKYPKTWSAYVDTSAQGSQPIDGYFNPNFVPGIQTNSTYALRLQVTADGYNDELQNFDSPAQSGQVKITPYSFPNVKGVVGVKIVGQLNQNLRGTMILIPLRDKTLKLWTETDQFQADFYKYILPNFKYSP